MLRPLVEFCAQVYHPLLIEEQEEKLEGLQKIALRIIYGFGMNYCDLLKKANLSTLKERREKAFIKFANQLSQSERFKEWFPLSKDVGMSLRNIKKIEEQYARTDRLYRSPLYSMRRALNKEEEDRKTTD